MKCREQRGACFTEALKAAGFDLECGFIHVELAVDLDLDRVNTVFGLAKVTCDEAALVGCVGVDAKAMEFEVSFNGV